MSRYKFDRSREFIPVYRVNGGHWRSVAPRPVRAKRVTGVQIVSEPEIYHGAGFQLRADTRFAQRSGAKVGVRVPRPLRICLGCRSKSKKCDKQLTFIVRVMWRFLLIQFIFCYET